MRKLNRLPALAASALLTILLLLPLSTALAQEKDYGSLLDKGLSSDEAYAYSLLEEAEGAENRLDLLKEALKFSPDVPGLYFELSRASLPDFSSSVKYGIGGLKAYGRSFWWSLSLAGLLFASLMASLVIAAAAVVLIRLPVQIPLLAHDINEGKAKFLIPALLLPAALGGPLFFLAGAMIVAGVHLKKFDKAPVYIVLVALAASPLLVRVGDTILSASASPELRAVAAVNEGRDNSYALQALKESSSPEARFSYALALKRDGRYEEAIAIYNGLAGKKPDWVILNNLANAYSATGQMERAKEAYGKALEMRSNAVVLYNLSQVHRGTLDYAAGDKYYQEASALDRGLVSKFTSMASTNPNRFVVDAVYPASGLRNLAREERRKVLSPFPIGTMPAVGLAAFLLVVAIALDMMVKSKAFRCSRCERIVCNICSRDSRWGQMCPDCYGALVKVKDADRQQRVSALLAAYEHKDKIRKKVRILSFLPPGIAHIYAGKALGGMLLLWAFAFCATALWLNPFVGTGLAGLSHSWLNLPLVAAMAVLYLSSTIYVNGRLESGWL